MSTTLAVGFPLGRYHANPWDRAVNEGATEWPPSPWRVLRALVAAWHNRWPGLPAAALDGILAALASPSAYRTPHTAPGHTRHYLPDLDHRKGQHGNTDLTLDPFLWLDPAAELMIRWDADLEPEQREVLGKLAELLPYLGRAESVCRARLLGPDEEPVADESWWHLGAEGDEHVRLLGPALPVSRAVLEVTTTDVRARRRTVPPGTEWVSYGRTRPAEPQPRRTARDDGVVTAVRFAVLSQTRTRMRATRGLLLADEVHRQAGEMLKAAGIADSRRHQILGTKGARTDHAHAHWIPVPTDGNPGAFCDYVLIWVPGELRTSELRALLGLCHADGRRGDYEVPGFPPLELRFQAAGPVEQVAPALCGRAARWRSLTPYLPVRHPKREPQEEFLISDVTRELAYRRLPAPRRVTRTEPGEQLTDHWGASFRRRREKERLSDKRSRNSRPGLGLRLEFDEPVAGPLVLGQLSHFGFGLFAPEPDI